ncbi:MAG: aldolase/citrate lyase family protein [Chloroflexota bacterium]
MSAQPSLKSRINRGDLIIGVGMPLTTSRDKMEEILSKDDYAYIAADSQHSAFNEERLAEFCGYAAEFNMPVQFRIKHTRHTYLIGNMLDLGPAGVEVPQVESLATVDEALEFFYYPQKGKRSWGGPGYGADLGLDRLGYAKYWNETGVLWIQIESINAVTQAGAFAKAGVDCLSWGPADLQFSLEAHPGHPFQSDDDCLRHVLQQLKGTGIQVAYRSYDPGLRNKYIDMGVTVLLERAQI